jgi:hypothetical protein
MGSVPIFPSDRQFFDVDQDGRGAKISVDDWIA